MPTKLDTFFDLSVVCLLGAHLVGCLLAMFGV
jgi:hypothetical protein